MAKSAHLVYLDNDLNVQVPSSSDCPGGRVIQLKKGYVDLAEHGLENHPVLSRLRLAETGAADRQVRLRKAEDEYNAAVNDAAVKLAKARSDIAKEEADARQGMAEEYAKRRDAAYAQGVSFNEPHPDPETRRAMTLTAPAAAMATVPSDTFANTAVTADERQSVRKPANPAVDADVPVTADDRKSGRSVKSES